MKQLPFLNTIFILWFCLSAAGQPYTLQVSIKNQPDNPVVLGTVRGDKFAPVDTLELQQVGGSLPAGNNLGSQNPIQQVASGHLLNQQKRVSWQFPENAVPGIYRLIFGQTTYARVMGESPQQLDFIFNNENIEFETDFREPQESLVVLQSEENRVWFDFLRKDAELKKHLHLLEQEVDYFQSKFAAEKVSSEPGAELKELEQKTTQKANVFNQLQLERDRFISNTETQYRELYASRLIRLFREPLRDGYLLQQERIRFYQQEYFRHIDFSDEALIYSAVLTDKIFDYLVTFNQREFNEEQREQAYIKALDAVMNQIEPVISGTQTSNPVYEFVLNYLMDGFERLNMGNVLYYMAENYSENLCQTDEKTTLERKLEYQKMKPGDRVSDFTLDNLKGEPVTLSHVLKPKNLILFWASWCSHCTAMLPQLKAWRRQFQPTELEIIAVSLDTSANDWQKVVRETGFDEFFNLSDLKEWEGEVAKRYNVYATPTIFVVDQNQKILAKPTSMSELIGYFGQ